MYTPSSLDASNFVSSYNTALYFIGAISITLLIALTFTMLYFVYKYNRKRNKVATQIEGNTRLEVIWTVIPIMLALGMFHFGWVGWKPMNKAPKDAMNITTIARQWSFTFSYDNGKQSADMVVPVNVPIKANLVSLDVNHSLFIPQFRVKADIIPGRKKFMWFIPQAIGKYQIYCAEYCGLRHSYMGATLTVLSKADFDKWYATGAAAPTVAGGSPAAAAGLNIMKIQGCFACHTPDGTKLIGPSYLNLWGSQQVVVRDGKEITITVDAEYVKRSILEPNADITKGFPANLMQSYRSTVSDDDIARIIEYLKTVNDK